MNGAWRSWASAAPSWSARPVRRRHSARRRARQSPPRSHRRRSRRRRPSQRDARSPPQTRLPRQSCHRRARAQNRSGCSVSAGGHCLAMRRDDLDRADMVNRQAILAGEPANAAAKSEPTDANGGRVASGQPQAVRMQRPATSPQVSPASSRAVRGARYQSRWPSSARGRGRRRRPRRYSAPGCGRHYAPPVRSWCSRANAMVAATSAGRGGARSRGRAARWIVRGGVGPPGSRAHQAGSPDIVDGERAPQ